MVLISIEHPFHRHRSCLHHQACGRSSSVSFVCLHRQASMGRLRRGSFISSWVSFRCLHWQILFASSAASLVLGLPDLHSHIFFGLSCITSFSVFIGQPCAWPSSASFACLHRQILSVSSSAVRVHNLRRLHLHAFGNIGIFIGSLRPWSCPVYSLAVLFSVFIRRPRA